MADAKGGSAESMYRLGLRYLHGAGTDINYLEAARCFRAAGKLPCALLNLGLLLLEGRGVVKDVIAGTALVLAAAEAGEAAAQCNYSIILARGLGGRCDLVESARWAKQAAMRGSIEGCQCLGVMYAAGSGVPRDFSEALHMFQIAAEGGRHDAFLSIASILDEGGDGVVPDPAKALEWKRRAAAAGIPEGVTTLAEALDRGLGTPVDRAGAAVLYKAAAEAGVLSAAVNLGVLYENGDGVQLDLSEAVRWYRVASDAGSASGQLNLARCLEFSLGVTQDRTEALRLYRMAAAVRPLDWYQIPTEQVTPTFANLEAQYTLGVIYVNGDGVPVDLKEAHRWISMAAAGGHKNAQARLKQVEAALDKLKPEGQY